MRKQIGLLSSALIAISLSAKSFANTAYGDWEVIDSACTARTATYLDSSTYYSLNVTIDKTGRRPVEVTIKPENAKSSPVGSFQVNLDGRHIYSFTKLPNAGGADVFWNLPLNTAALMQEMKASGQMNIAGVQGGELPFSMEGATAALNALQAKCGSQPVAFSAAFESAFADQDAVSRVKISKMTPALAAQLRDLVAQAVIAFQGVQAVQTDLAKLEQNFRQLTQERDQLQATLNQLNQHLADLTRRRDAAIQAIAQAQQDIVNLNASIQSETARLATAQAAYDQAVKAIQPFVPEHDRLLGILQNAQSRLAAAQSNLMDIQQGIANDQARIAALNSEYQQLNNQLSSWRAQEYQVQAAVAQADADVRAFNPHAEFDRLRAANPRLQQLDADLRNLRQQISNQTANVNSLQSEYSARQRDLSMCLGGGHARFDYKKALLSLVIEEAYADGMPGRPGGGGPGGDHGHGGPGEGPGNGPHPGPGPGPRPNPPPTPAPAPPPAPAPAPAPAPNCSAQQQALNDVGNRLNQAQAALNNLQQSFNSENSESSQIMNQIQNQVQQELSNLQWRAQQAHQQLTDLQIRDQQIVDRMQAINSLDLPHVQNDLTSLQSQLPGAENELSASQQAEAAADADFQNFKRTVGYDQLENDMNRKLANVRSIQAGISRMQNQIRDDQSEIAEQTKLRDNLNAQIASTNQTIAQKQARLQQVDALLQPYDQEKQAILARLAAAQNVLLGIRGQFVALLP